MSRFGTKPAAYIQKAGEHQVKLKKMELGEAPEGNKYYQGPEFHLRFENEAGDFVVLTLQAVFESKLREQYNTNSKISNAFDTVDDFIDTNFGDLISIIGDVAAAYASEAEALLLIDAIANASTNLADDEAFKQGCRMLEDFVKQHEPNYTERAVFITLGYNSGSEYVGFPYSRYMLAGNPVVSASPIGFKTHKRFKLEPFNLKKDNAPSQTEDAGSGVDMNEL